LTTVTASLTGVSQPLANIYTVALATLLPFAGNDTIVGGTGNDTLLGGDGNDTITDQGGTSRDIKAGTGDDTVRLIGANLTGTVDGGAGNDQLDASGTMAGLTVTGFEILNTNASVLTGRATLFESFDTIRVSAANQTGTVSVILSATGAATVLNLTDELTTVAGHRGLHATGSTDGETITSGGANDRLFGGGGNDVLNAGAGDNWLLGGDGDDVLSTGDGNDILRGEAGNDTISAGGGNDIISDEGGSRSQVDAGAGNDGIRLEAPITTAVIDAGAGNDTILLLAATATADIDGGDGNDAITFGILDAASTVLGGAGDDTITAGGFSGQVDGGTGVDRFVGSADLTQTTLLGIEVLQGTFTLRAEQVPQFTNIIGGFVLAASGGPVVLDLTATSIASITGSSDNETLTIAGSVGPSGQLRAILYGNDGNDVLTTLGGFDGLYGGEGNDILNAGAGDDILRGGAGRDRLEGGDGNDQLFGEAGADTLNGGLGNDRIEERGGGATTLSGGDGVDDIVLFDGYFTGRIDGGAGADTLYLLYDDASSFDSDNITGLQIVSVESLYVQGFVTARVAQLEAFVKIIGIDSFVGSSDMVNIKLAASGRATEVDLLGALGSQAMRLYGSRDDETIFSTVKNDIIDGGGGRNTISYANL
jgi:Ca2+-binding RTX toxin-like protein